MHVATVLPGLGSEPRWRSLHARRLLQGARAGRRIVARYICDEGLSFKVEVDLLINCALLQASLQIYNPPLHFVVVSVAKYSRTPHAQRADQGLLVSAHRSVYCAHVPAWGAIQHAADMLKHNNRTQHALCSIMNS